MTNLRIVGGSRITGRCHVPGDKSISHRAIIFASIAEGVSRISNFLEGSDCHSTINVMRALGVQIQTRSHTVLEIDGRGLDGLQESPRVLDCGSSSTAMRLLTGLLAGQKFTSFLTGSGQVLRRPMRRFVRPLLDMGANIIGRQNGNYPPLGIAGSRLHSLDYTMPVASAQVKSCLLLAGLFGHGLTIVRQPGPARDHTERLLHAMGAPIAIYGNTIHSERPHRPLRSLNITIPGDISSAASIIVAASVLPGSQITTADVGINPTRIGLVHALQIMGANIAFVNKTIQSGEPVADLIVNYSPLRGATFGGAHIVTMIDELPILAVAATQSAGRTVVKNASELRVKESDRIASTVTELRKMGANIEPTADGFIIEGPTRLMGGTVECQGDPQVAMALAVAALVAQGPTTIFGANVIAGAFPGFESTLQALGADIEVDAQPLHA
jgi:3-phosphoshikimate 1-carboxyvinyltransferase